MNGYLALVLSRSRSRGESILGDYPRLRRALPTLAGGMIGVAVGGAHPVLSALLGGAVVRNAVDLAAGQTSLDHAARNVGSHALATIGALAVPAAPLVGYLGGVLASNAVIGTSWDPAPPLDDVRAGKAYISRGQKGSSVEYIQRGVGVEVDGKFGPDTEAAVKRFQAAMGGTQYGYVGANTLKDIDKALRGDPTADRGNVIPLVQPSTPRTSPSPGTQHRETTKANPASGGSSDVSQAAPPTESSGNFLQRPLYPGSSLTVWQGGLLGLGGAALLAAGISLARS